MMQLPTVTIVPAFAANGARLNTPSPTPFDNNLLAMLRNNMEILLALADLTIEQASEGYIETWTGSEISLLLRRVNPAARSACLDTLDSGCPGYFADSEDPHCKMFISGVCRRQLTRITKQVLTVSTLLDIQEAMLFLDAETFNSLPFRAPTPTYTAEGTLIPEVQPQPLLVSHVQPMLDFFNLALNKLFNGIQITSGFYITSGLSPLTLDVTNFLSVTSGTTAKQAYDITEETKIKSEWYAGDKIVIVSSTDILVDVNSNLTHEIETQVSTNLGVSASEQAIEIQLSIESAVESTERSDIQTYFSTVTNVAVTAALDITEVASITNKVIDRDTSVKTPVNAKVLLKLENTLIGD